MARLSPNGKGLVEVRQEIISALVVAFSAPNDEATDFVEYFEGLSHAVRTSNERHLLPDLQQDGYSAHHEAPAAQPATGTLRNLGTAGSTDEHVSTAPAGSRTHRGLDPSTDLKRTSALASERQRQVARYVLEVDERQSIEIAHGAVPLSLCVEAGRPILYMLEHPGREKKLATVFAVPSEKLSPDIQGSAFLGTAHITSIAWHYFLWW